ncbi:MAG: carboxylating nicotinate-nucleotide diphosphorylase [Chloroflexi bacterium]|nr:carboxylating nicotinate-nucleotide diphosphorylase [Chloroflexota bacterium]MDA1228412.1 carboxylating nicotinate-nucleotide diphosphorylase [Chloroflexota bacterium]
MYQITPETESLIDRAIYEDLSIGDPTTDLLIPPDLQGKASFVSKVEGVLAGIDVGLAVFKRIDPSLETKVLMQDGALLKPNDLIAEVSGSVASILKAERTALNFVRRLSGIATTTAAYVREVQGNHVRIIDTRKTTPGLRTLEKYAIRAGGGHNHRQNLGDGILIKDNHIEALAKMGLNLGDVIRKAHDNKSHTINVEVEVENLAQVDEALSAGAEILLLDNMGLEDMTTAVKMCEGKAVTEASGTITLERVRAVAETGVDLISVGALTHSSDALDISLDLTT